MKYKEFVQWCNERASDGCWGYTTAITCINIIDDMRSLSFWNRKKKWKQISEDVFNELVHPTNQKIEQWKHKQERNINQ